MTASYTRHRTLDGVRGFAVMGILLMNIVAFAMPQSAYVNPAAWGGSSFVDRATWFVTFVFFDGKMRGLFSMLFGASMLLVMDRAEMSGGNGRATHVSRMVWLFLLGFCHYAFIWWGDILMLYAVLGLVAMLFAGREPMSLVKWAFLFFAVHFVLLALMTLGLHQTQAAALAPGASAADIQGYRKMIEDLGAPGGAQIAKDIGLYTGPYLPIAAHRLQTFVGDITRGILFAGLDTLGFMLLGMAMLKRGFLTGDWDIGLYWRTFRHCFLIGLPPMIALAIRVAWTGFDPLTTFGAFLTWTFPFRIPLTVGFAALFLWLLLRHPHAPLADRIVATGRMAFSNYIGTSILMSSIFYGYGLGLYGQVGRAPLYLFVLGAWVLMLLWSRPWLDRFAYGPVEWLWRSLARRKLQPMRKSVPA